MVGTSEVNADRFAGRGDLAWLGRPGGAETPTPGGSGASASTIGGEAAPYCPTARRVGAWCRWDRRRAMCWRLSRATITILGSSLAACRARISLISSTPGVVSANELGLRTFALTSGVAQHCGEFVLVGMGSHSRFPCFRHKCVRHRELPDSPDAPRGGRTESLASRTSRRWHQRHQGRRPIRRSSPCAAPRFGSTCPTWRWLHIAQPI